MKVAFQGETGAYSEEAVFELCPDAEPSPCTAFEDVFAAVRDGNVEHGVIPIENSLFGSVHQNYDLLQEYPLLITGEVHLRVRHLLLGVRGSSIENIREPKELKSYPMEGPYGLGIDENLLFICDGEAGLKIYDAKYTMAIDDHQLATFTDVIGYDVIPLGDVLILIGDDGLYQYDYSDVENISLISKIELGE